MRAQNAEELRVAPVAIPVWLRSGAGVVGALVLAAGCVYLASWLFASAYLSCFGASWILAQMPQSRLLGFATAPLLELSIGLAITSYVLLDHLRPWRPIPPIVIALSLAISVPLCCALLGWPTTRVALLQLSLGLVLGVAFLVAFHTLRSPERWRACGRHAAALFVIGSLFGLPAASGWLLGHRDRNPSTSRLPSVGDGDDRELRVLFATANRIYATNLAEARTRIHLIPAHERSIVSASPSVQITSAKQ